jgi:hypothetical protein
VLFYDEQIIWAPTEEREIRRFKWCRAKMCLWGAVDSSKLGPQQQNDIKNHQLRDQYIVQQSKAEGCSYRLVFLTL